ncbi:MAG: hypothetical protein CMC13_15765 [Flavobacteriaceae bacterium]|mgnify:CR=1 FL=1|nr:hypothetical protein [Flavobacteriaceae bacterium]|tara:strand:- start:2092 stop:3393 length:1302 start_codon:yes stop_codon:yes gene_type:complete
MNSEETLVENKPLKKEGYKKTKLGWIPEEWEVTKLEELGEFKNGINKSKDDFGFGVPFINLMDVFGKPVLTKDKWSLVNASPKEIESYSLNKGDVLFIRSSVKLSGVGLTSVVKEGVSGTVYSGFLIRFRPYHKSIFDNNYLQYCFYENAFRHRLISKSTSSANTNINQNSLKQLQLALPPLPEQRKIADILSTWDKAIVKQEQLITQKQALKKGLMQELLTGKKRFRGFEEEWEEVRISEIATTFSGGTPSSKKKEYYNGNIPWLKSGELNKGIIEKTEGYISELGLENSSAKIVEVDTILIAMYGATAGVCAITKIQGAINQAVLAINLTEEDDNFFIYQLLRMKMPNIVHRMVQGGQPNLSGGIINSVKLKLPKTKEQQKIAAVLSNFDTELEHLEDHKNALIAQKRGLMQQLLTGEKRVEITDYEKRKN